MQNITQAINKAITTKKVLQQQAGSRFIVTIHVKDNCNYTSHYKDYSDMLKDFDKYASLYGESNTTWSCSRASELLATK